MHYLRRNYLFFIVLFLLASCIPQKRLLLLQDKDKTAPNEFKLPIYIHHIKPGDNLYITVTGIDEKTASMFNLQKAGSTGFGNQGYQSGSGTTQSTGMYLWSYTVNDSGYISFPLVKGIFLKGLNLRDAQKIIQDSVNQYANYTTAIIKYVSFKVTVLGEVINPGQVLSYDEHLSLFELFGLSGDMTDYANRNRITITRKTDTGLVLKYVDVTDKKFLGSEYFYLHPDDIVYVPPMTAKSFGLRNFQLGTALSLVSSVLLFINIFKL